MAGAVGLLLVRVAWVGARTQGVGCDPSDSGPASGFAPDSLASQSLGSRVCGEQTSSVYPPVPRQPQTPLSPCDLDERRDRWQRHRVCPPGHGRRESAAGGRGRVDEWHVILRLGAMRHSPSGDRVGWVSGYRRYGTAGSASGPRDCGALDKGRYRVAVNWSPPGRGR
jgi:hypothetical protein